MLCAWSHDAVQIILRHVLHTYQHCIAHGIWLLQWGHWFWRNAHQKICTDGTPVMIDKAYSNWQSCRITLKALLASGTAAKMRVMTLVTWTTHIAYTLCMLASLSASINFPDEPLEQIVSLVACCFDWSISCLPSQSNVANKQAHNQSSLPVFGAHQLNVWMHERSINLLVID